MVVCTCRKCGKIFPAYPRVNGHTYNNARRKLCYECNPFKSGKRYSTGTKPCKKCGLNKKTRGLLCDPCYRMIRRWENKLKAVKLLGGKCIACGWNKHPAGLDFHHHNNDKEFAPAQILSFSWEKFWNEVSKCVLLCACCHRIKHCKFEFTKELVATC